MRIPCPSSTLSGVPLEHRKDGYNTSSFGFDHFLKHMCYDDGRSTEYIKGTRRLTKKYVTCVLWGDTDGKVELASFFLFSVWIY